MLVTCIATDNRDWIWWVFFAVDNTEITGATFRQEEIFIPKITANIYIITQLLMSQGGLTGEN